MRLVSWVSISDKPAHVEAEGEEAGAQQVAQSSQVRDGEVVGVHASAPHPVNHPVCHVEKDHHLQEAEAEQVVWEEPQEVLEASKGSFKFTIFQQESKATFTLQV